MAALAYDSNERHMLLVKIHSCHIYIIPRGGSIGLEKYWHALSSVSGTPQDGSISLQKFGMMLTTVCYASGY